MFSYQTPFLELLGVTILNQLNYGAEV